MMLVKLGKYKIESVLGGGSTGIVYKAFDPERQRTVALKTVRIEKSTENKANCIHQFENECWIVQRLSHPNIVSVLECGEVNNTPYMVMEYVQGKPLSAIMSANRLIERADAINWITQLLHALTVIHSLDIVHQDISAKNLLLTDDGILKVTDFGAAVSKPYPLVQRPITAGTPSYMSPEQLKGSILDARSDLYSAGVLLYQLLTGKPPFSGCAVAIIKAILTNSPADPTELNPELPAGFDRLLRIALAKDRDNRFQSASLFLNALLVLDVTIPEH